MATKTVLDDRQQAGIEELAVRDVDIYTDCAVVRPLPLPDLATHLVDDPVPERDDETDVFNIRQEVRRRHETAFRVPPTHERLESIGAFGLETDDRLVMDLELLLIECQAKLRLHSQPCNCVRPHRDLEHCG